MTKFNVKLTSFGNLETEALAVFVWEDEKELPKETAWLNQALGGLLQKITHEEEFKGESGKILTFHTHGKIAPSRILVVGLGKKEEFSLLELRKNFALLGKKAKELKIKSLGFGLSFSQKPPFDLKKASQASIEGLILGTYKFLRYKGEEERQKEKEIEEVVLAAETAPNLVLLKEGIKRGEIFSEATIFVRDLVNEPASVTTPAYLAQVAKTLNGGQVKCRVFDKNQMVKMDLGGILGVARGSEEPPKLIRLEYKHPKAQKKIVLVGKAITFDAGGLSLKSQEAMETMKMDMAGGAAILGIFSVLAKLNPKVWLVGFVPATENMPSGRALKPGDILKVRNGKTIEVTNTDAEGRIILADALCLGVEEKPDLILDLATLTGACIVALGEEVAGLFGTDEAMMEKVKKAAQEAGEQVWPMPLTSDYRELLKSEVADIRNLTKSKYGGAITAALFLKEFVDKTPWVHLDIAGPAYAEKSTSLIPPGGSGFGVRTILEFLISKLLL